MRFLPSLRSRLVLAAVLWMLSLFAVGLMVSTYTLVRYKAWPQVLHGSTITHTNAYLVGTVLCIFGGLVAVRSALSPFSRLRTHLAAVHAGSHRRVEGAYPSEVQPLVNDLNSLLEHQEQMVRRAIAKAGDLAHGLKTPLAVLAQEAERAEADGHREMAAVIGQQVERMRRQVEYHLAHARAAASGVTPGARCPVLPSVEGLVRTLQRLHSGRGLTFDVNVASEHAIRGQREDLDEMLGNLLDNACKWARSRVTITSCQRDNHTIITVDDDGMGLAEEKWEAVLQRGVRADEAAPGSGFGLAIVRELAELYGGGISLGRSPGGGVRATLTLPGA